MSLTSRRTLLKSAAAISLHATNAALGAKPYGARMPAWTYSQLDTFETCPRKFYHLKVAKDVVDPPTVHTDWGKNVHSAFELRIKDGAPMPDGMQQWETLAKKIASAPGDKLPEVQLALTRDFKPAKWDNAWTRGIADLVILHEQKAAVLDYKTGKRKPSEQLDLYANYVFHHYEHINQVTTGFVWLKEKTIDWKVIKREEVPVIWQSFLPRIRKLESAYERDSWPAKTSGLCRSWCPVTSCEFNGRKNG